jgi:hypothetical protein
MSTSVATEVAVANLALQRIGVGAIDALTDNDKAAKAANRIFADTRDEIQRMFSWTCLIDREALSTSTASAASFSYVHTLGLDCLTVLNILDTSDSDAENIPYRREYRHLYTNQQTGYVRYTKQTTNITPWEPLMLTALETRLASKLAVWLTGKAALAQMMQQEFMQTITLAIQVKAIEDRFEDSTKMLAMIDKSFLPFLAQDRAIAE